MFQHRYRLELSTSAQIFLLFLCLRCVYDQNQANGTYYNVIIPNNRIIITSCNKRLGLAADLVRHVRYTKSGTKPLPKFNCAVYRKSNAGILPWQIHRTQKTICKCGSSTYRLIDFKSSYLPTSTQSSIINPLMCFSKRFRTFCLLLQFVAEN